MPNCVFCSSVVDESIFVPGFGGFSCRPCADHNYLARCYNCGEYHEDNHVYYMAVPVGAETRTEIYCLECRDGLFFECPACNNFRLLGDRQENGNCRLCHNRVPVYPYNFKPAFKFFSLPNERSKLFYGIELELELMDCDVEVLGKTLPSSLYLKHDGSLSHGVEIVSHPMTMGYLKANHNIWDNAIDTWADAGCESHYTNTCGMHVHMSIEAFTHLQLYKFCEFIRRNKDFILHFTGRSRTLLDRWAYVDTVDMAKKKAMFKNQQGYDRHSAINLATGSTVEIRIFKGTLRKTEFWRNLEFCEALYDFTLSQSTQELDAYSFRNFVIRRKHAWARLRSALG